MKLVEIAQSKFKLISEKGHFGMLLAEIQDKPLQNRHP
jgi:hypothetical protein